mmetsp:Transcript_4720/g.9177  ORF Transcript_4720/g.9177 Transcript_4720/m.9177 type:complete len:95 (-) Transcript_4720:295-579(-)
MEPSRVRPIPWEKHEDGEEQQMRDMPRKPSGGKEGGRVSRAQLLPRIPPKLPCTMARDTFHVPYVSSCPPVSTMPSDCSQATKESAPSFFKEFQ